MSVQLGSREWVSKITLGEHAGLKASGKTKAQARANLKAKLKRRKQKEMQFTENELSGLIKMLECCLSSIDEKEKQEFFEHGDWDIHNQDELDQLSKKLWYRYKNTQGVK